jgi:ABC-type Zn uptake system ZnuABC Zn-binding protein ZnuA
MISRTPQPNLRELLIKSIRQMRKLLVTLLFFTLALTACQANPAAPATLQPASPLKVTAIETFLGDIAQNVAGNRVRVESLIPIGIDPHSFDPSPQDIVKLAQAQVIIANGAGFETWLQKVIDNTGEQATLIEAATGLTPRTAREGEVAEMSDADLTDSMCADAAGPAQAASAGADLANAAVLPSESGLFTVQLAAAPDGTFHGYFRYSTDETGDFQIATASGKVDVLAQPGSSPVKIGKTLRLSCQNLAQGDIVTLTKSTPYVLELSSFSSAQASLLVGPAGGIHHHDTDPHFWLDPNNVIQYVQNIRDGLTKADPQGAANYTHNAAAYIAKLKELDAWIQAQVSTIPPERRLLVTNHESFGYFADRYGFRIVGTVVPSVGTEESPSAQQIARLEDRINATHAIAIFLETGANAQLANQVASDTGVKVVSDLFTHSISAPGGQAPTYIDMMKFDVTEIVNALK